MHIEVLMGRWFVGTAEAHQGAIRKRPIPRQLASLAVSINSQSSVHVGEALAVSAETLIATRACRSVPHPLLG